MCVCVCVCVCVGGGGGYTHVCAYVHVCAFVHVHCTCVLKGAHVGVRMNVCIGYIQTKLVVVVNALPFTSSYCCGSNGCPAHTL